MWWHRLLNKLVKTYVTFKLHRAKEKVLEEHSLALWLIHMHGFYTLEKVTKFVLNTAGIKYKPDQFFGLCDTQQTLKKLLATKKGDCDDFQLAYTHLSWAQGYDSYYVTMINRKLRYNHAICIAKEKNRFYQLDTVNITPIGPFDSIHDMVDYYSRLVESPYICIDVRDQFLRYVEDYNEL